MEQTAAERAAAQQALVQQALVQQALGSIPRQGGSPAAAGEHWLVARLHEERRTADRARLSELLAAAESPLVEAVRRTAAAASEG